MHPVNMTQVAVCVNWPLESGSEIIRGIREFTLARPNWDVRYLFSFEGPTLGHSSRPRGAISSVGNKDLRAAFGQIRGPIVGLSTLPERADVWIRADQVAIGRQAAEHLRARGFRRFGYLSLVHPDSASREEGFRQGVSACGGTVSVCRYEPTRTAPIAAWLKSLEKPAAVFCFNDYTARDLLMSCRMSGVRVPEEIALIGVDNEVMWCEVSQPQITSVALPWRRFGYEAAAALERLMDGEAPPPNRTIQLAPIGVVTRQSTDTLAIPDPELARVLAYLRGRACDGLTLSSLLRDQSINARWLHRKCRQHLGRSPHEEILRVQIERAKSLLSHTALQIKEIARQVGLSRAHFADTFAKVVGATPSAYREATRH